MAELAKAYVQIIPSAEGIQGSLTSVMDGEAESAGQSAGGKFGSAFGTVAKTGLAAVGALAGAVTGAGAAIVKGAGDVASYGDHIDKMSQKMGLSIEAYQEWDAVMQHSGTSIESMQSSMKTLANAVENGNDAFERLGMSQEDIAAMSNEELFSATITALQNVENETERTYLAGQVLGRGATELGALLNTSAEETQAMKDRVHELGGVMSDEAVKSAAAYQDSLQDMQTSFSGLKNNLMSEFLPGITGVMDGLTAIFAGDSEGGLSQISDGVQTVIDSISEKLPEFLSLGSEILMSLANAIIENLPELMGAGSQIILSLITDGIIPNLPDIISSGLEVILALVQGITDSLPELLPAAVECVLTIVDRLTQPDMLSDLIDAALELIIALAEGLIDALPELIAKAPELVRNLMQAIIDNAPKLLLAALKLVIKLGEGIIQNVKQLLNAAGEIVTTIVNAIADLGTKIWNIGKDIVEGIWSGISGTAEWLWDKVSGWASNLFDKVKGFFGIASPSKLFAEIGVFLAEGLGEGIEDGTGMVTQAVKDMSDAAINAWDADSLTTAYRTTGKPAFFTGTRMAPKVSDWVGSDSGIATIADLITKALQGCGIYMDGQTVGRLVTRAQTNAARAYGG